MEQKYKSVLPGRLKYYNFINNFGLDFKWFSYKIYIYNFRKYCYLKRIVFNLTSKKANEEIQILRSDIGEK